MGDTGERDIWPRGMRDPDHALNAETVEIPRTVASGGRFLPADDARPPTDPGAPRSMPSRDRTARERAEMRYQARMRHGADAPYLNDYERPNDYIRELGPRVGEHPRPAPDAGRTPWDRDQILIAVLIAVLVLVGLAVVFAGAEASHLVSVITNGR